MEWTFEELHIAPDRWQYLAWLWQDSPEGSICSESATNIWCYLARNQDSQSRSLQGVEMGVASLTITSSDPVAKLLLLSTLCSADLEVLVPEGALTRRHNNDPTELEVKITTQLLQVPPASESTGKEGN